MSYTKPYIYDKVRPAAIVQALKHLIDTPLYKDDNVTLAPNWDAQPQGSYTFFETYGLFDEYYKI